jgi:RNA polymerase sigma-70 factor (ECF subfamily)
VSRPQGLAALLIVPGALARLTPVPDVLVLDGRGRNEHVTDADLVRRARAGEDWAHEMIYRRHVRLVATAARRLLRADADVDDVVQETFLIAFEKIGALLDGDVLRAWLVKIAISRVHRRYRWRRFVAVLGGDGPDALLAEQASSDASPEQRAELALLDRALARLPLALRTPWVLRHVVGFQLEDVAAACDCSLATVKRRITAAETVVREHLGVSP